MSDLTVDTTPVVRILRRALVVLDRDGWSPSGWNSNGKCRCVGNAIVQAGIELEMEGRVLDAAEGFADHLTLTLPPEWVLVRLGDWNDTPGRTFTEVADALEACATGLEPEAVAS